MCGRQRWRRETETRTVWRPGSKASEKESVASRDMGNGKWKGNAALGIGLSAGAARGDSISRRRTATPKKSYRRAFEVPVRRCVCRNWGSELAIAVLRTLYVVC